MGLLQEVHERLRETYMFKKAATPRRLPRSSLEAALAMTVYLGQQTVEVSQRKGEVARDAVLEGRATTVTLVPPTHSKKRTYAPVMVQVVLACEVAPPPGVKALRWVLLTSLPVATFAQAREVLRYYALRWLIERYHLVLKSGCHIKRLQLTSLCIGGLSVMPNPFSSQQSYSGSPKQKQTP